MCLAVLKRKKMNYKDLAEWLDNEGIDPDDIEKLKGSCNGLACIF